MNDFLEKIKEFQKTFNAPVLEKPEIPQRRKDLRYELIREELNEFKDANKEDDLTESADALCDMMVVLCGSILEFGMGDVFNELFNEVHRSNMTKACKTKQEAMDTVKHYKDNKNTRAYIMESDGLFVVYRKDDNKILKSINYSKANLKPILEKALK